MHTNRSRVRRVFVPAAAASVAVASAAVFGGGHASAGVLAPCAPTLTIDGADTVATFTTVGDCFWTVPASAATVDVLVVGGGGSGGRSDERSTGGGGGGGVAYGEGVALSGTFVITVGAGGTNIQSCGPWPESAFGGHSSISNVGMVDPAVDVSIIADGGARGAGCSDGDPAPSGGSGGGGHSNWVPNGGSATQGTVDGVTGIDLYGNAGGDGTDVSGLAGGGGGGATSVGGDGTSGGHGGDGGEGVGISISGSLVVYGSGGGGIGTVDAGEGGTNAGDGHPEIIPADVATVYDGVANTGGGGGAAYTETSGFGGSGVVVVRYPSPPTLPGTGSSTGPLAAIAAAFVVLGGGMLRVRRRA